MHLFESNYYTLQHKYWLIRGIFILCQVWNVRSTMHRTSDSETYLGGETN